MKRNPFFRSLWVAVAALIVLVALVPPARAVAPFTIVAMPDIQNETQYYPAALTSEVNWIVNNQTSQNIVFVAQQGDLTNNANTTEFTTAQNNMFLLNNAPGLAWGTVPGNHDLANASLYDSYFGPSNFTGQSWYGGSYAHSSYQTFNAGGRNYLMLDIEYDAPTNVIDWAQSVINANPGDPTIVNTHDYLTSGGRTSYGDTLWSSLVNPNSQVFMVLCGHMHYEYNQTSTDQAGQPVFELLANYQDNPYGPAAGGCGYERLYQFDEANSVIHVETFSPYDTTGGADGTYQTGPDSQFDLPMNFNSRLGVVPEPSTIAMLLTVGGLGGLWLVGRLARRQLGRTGTPAAR